MPKKKPSLADWFQFLARHYSSRDFFPDNAHYDGTCVTFNRSAVDSHFGKYLSLFREREMALFQGDNACYLAQRRKLTALQLAMLHNLSRTLVLQEDKAETYSLLTLIGHAVEEMFRPCSDGPQKHILFIDIDWIRKLLRSPDTQEKAKLLLRDPRYTIVLLSQKASLADFIEEFEQHPDSELEYLGKCLLLCTGGLWEYIDIIDYLLDKIKRHYGLSRRPESTLIVEEGFLVPPHIEVVFEYFPLKLPPILNSLDQLGQLITVNQQKHIQSVLPPIELPEQVQAIAPGKMDFLFMRFICYFFSSFFRSATGSSDTGHLALLNAVIAHAEPTFHELRSVFGRADADSQQLLKKVAGQYGLMVAFEYRYCNPLITCTILHQMTELARNLALLIQRNTLRLLALDFDGTMFQESKDNFMGGECLYWAKLVEKLRDQGVYCLSVTQRPPLFGVCRYYAEITSKDRQLGQIFAGHILMGGFILSKAEFIVLLELFLKKLHPDIRIDWMLIDDMKEEIAAAQERKIPCFQMPELGYPRQESVEDFLRLPFVGEIAEVFNLQDFEPDFSEDSVSSASQDSSGDPSPQPGRPLARSAIFLSPTNTQQELPSASAAVDPAAEKQLYSI